MSQPEVPWGAMQSALMRDASLFSAGSMSLGRFVGMVQAESFGSSDGRAALTGDWTCLASVCPLAVPCVISPDQQVKLMGQ